MPKKVEQGSSPKEKAQAKRIAAVRAHLLRPHTPEELAKLQAEAAPDFIIGYEHHDQDSDGHHSHVHKLKME